MTDDPHHDPLADPSKLPPPGWYADPENPGRHRWWDGTQWTSSMLDQQLPAPPSGASGLDPVGPWLSSVMDLIRERAGHIFTLILAISVPASIAAGVLTFLAVEELSVTVDDAAGTFDFDGFEPIDGYLFGASILLTTVAGLVLAAAIVHQAGHAQNNAPRPWGESLVHALLRLPRIIGAFLGLIGILVVATVGFTIVAGLAGGVALGLLAALAVIVVALLVGVRLSLVTTGAAVAPRGVSSFAASWRLTSGRFWPMLGRLLLLGCIAIGIQLAGGLIVAPISAAFGNQVNPDDTTIVVADLFGAANLPLYLALQILSALIGGLTSAVWGIGLFALYRRLGGQIAPELGVAETPGPGV